MNIFIQDYNSTASDIQCILTFPKEMVNVELMGIHSKDINLLALQN